MLNWYFKPKTAEFCGDKTVYDLLGIRFYKKYLPTTGDIVRRKRKIVQIRQGADDKTEELYKYERKTRNYEWRHLIGIVGFIVISLLIDRKFSVFDWIFVFVLNMYVNVYPIFLQLTTGYEL